MSTNEDALRDRLLARLKEKGSELNALQVKMERHWGIEDRVYRFYHQSLKVYSVQGMTQEAVELLQSLLPERPLNTWFMHIVSEGTGKAFELSHNENWLHHTRPMIEALFQIHPGSWCGMAEVMAQGLDEPEFAVSRVWCARGLRVSQHEVC